MSECPRCHRPFGDVVEAYSTGEQFFAPGKPVAVGVLEERFSTCHACGIVVTETPAGITTTDELAEGPRR